MARVRLGVWLAMALAGCGASRRVVRADDAGPSGAGAAGVSSAAGAAGAPDDTDPVAAMAAWRTRLAAAHCERDQRCGPLWQSEDDCLANADAWPAYVRFFGDVDQDAYLATTHTLAAAATLDACVSAVSDTECGDERTSYEACLGVLVPKAPRQNGEACAYDSPYVLAPACATGLVCSATYGCGVCVPLPPAQGDGGHCTASQDCAAGLVCVAGACRAYASLPGEGETADASGVCRDGLESWTGSLVCTRLGAANEPCDPLSFSCLNNLTCERDPTTGAGVCRSLASRGDACLRVSQGDTPSGCDRSNWCVFPSADAATGTCEIAPTTPGPCPLFGDDGPYFCPAGTYADVDIAGSLPPTPCTCKLQLDTGARCDSDVQCAHGYCATDRDGDDGRCVSLLPDGAACVPNDRDHCSSFLGCDLDAGTCAAACVNGSQR